MNPAIAADPLLLLVAGLAVDALVRRHARGVPPDPASGRAGRPRRRVFRPQAQPRDPQRSLAPGSRRRHRDRAGRACRSARAGDPVAVPRQPSWRGGRDPADRRAGRPAQPLRSRRRGGAARSTEAGSRPGARRCGISSAATRRASTRTASPAPRSRAWPRISATAWWRRRSGICCSGCRACSPTRWRTRSTA